MKPKNNEKICVSRLREKLSYDSETGDLIWIKAKFSSIGKVAGCLNNLGYRRLVIDDVQLLGHRIAWALHYGVWPESQIDHINGNPSDNRIANLRIATIEENSRNRRMDSKNTSGQMGVYRCRKKWAVQIYKKDKKIYLGSYSDKNVAISVRKKAERDYGYHPNHGAR